jgi:hypothetical protein
MNKAFEKAEELVSHIKEYANSSIDAAKLHIADKSSKVISNV